MMKDNYMYILQEVKSINYKYSVHMYFQLKKNVCREKQSMKFGSLSVWNYNGN